MIQNNSKEALSHAKVLSVIGAGIFVTGMFFPPLWLALIPLFVVAAMLGSAFQKDREHAELIEEIRRLKERT